MLIGLTVVVAGIVGLLLLRHLAYPVPYREAIVRSATRHAMDPDLVLAIMREESRFRPRAVSPRGALGLMQLMPRTADWIAGEIGYPASEDLNLFDPETNIELGVGYLAHLVGHFDGSIPLAIAAYNRGMTRVQRWVDQGVWCGSAAELDRIPTEETRIFVRRVLRSYTVYRTLDWMPYLQEGSETIER